MEDITLEEILFFDRKQAALALYRPLREKILESCGAVNIQVRKTQISFVSRHIFAAVSFTPVRRAKERPENYITVTFGLDAPVDSPRIDAVVEIRPHRWTHHVLIGDPAEIDTELLGWIQEAAAFSKMK